MHNLLPLALVAAAAVARPMGGCSTALGRPEVSRVQPHRLHWTRKGLAEGLRELMLFARRGELHETARVIDLRRGQWAEPTVTHFGEHSKVPDGIELDMTAIGHALNTRRRLILAHTHPRGEVPRMARSLKVDVNKSRPFLTLWNGLPSVTDIHSDLVLKKNGFAIEQWVVSSRYVIAFSANADTEDAAAAYERLSTHLVSTIKRVGAGEIPLDVTELIAMVNAHPHRPVQLRLVKRF